MPDRRIQDFVITHEQLIKLLTSKEHCVNLPKGAKVLQMFYDEPYMGLRIRLEHESYCYKTEGHPIYHERAVLNKE